MGRRRRSWNGDERCYRCATVASERAHVFPRQLFLKPRPTNLPTVPSCEACNRSFGEDERLFAIATIDYDHPYGKRLWDRQVRPRLQHERSAGFRTMLARSVSPLLVPRERGGAYGNPIHLDRERIKQVLSNVARGLAYHHAGDILPTDIRFVYGIFGALDAPAPEIIGQLATGAPVRQRLGQDVFAYQWASVPGENHATFTRLTFYGTRQFAVMTIPAHLTGTPASAG